MSSAPTPTSSPCPGCGGRHPRGPLYAIDGVPVLEAFPFRTRQAALDGPRSDVSLRVCTICGLVWNARFDEGLITYDPTYEGSQGFSPTFRRFQEALARDLIERCGGLAGRQVVEIGCGQGEFLDVLAPMAGLARAVGFDPIVRQRDTAAGVELINGWYDRTTAPAGSDLVLCIMTLEHVLEVGAFLDMVRDTMRDRPGARLYLMIPDFRRILEERAFWELHYEHCTYYSPGTLARLLRRHGFVVEDVWRSFNDQYLSAMARQAEPDEAGAAAALPAEESLPDLLGLVDAFAHDVNGSRQAWRQAFKAWHRRGERVYLWGAASRSVAFVTSLGLGPELAGLVDINPGKQNAFLPGTGHPIAATSMLVEGKADRVVVMSPVYMSEIGRMIAELGIDPELERIDRAPALPVDRAA